MTTRVQRHITTRLQRMFGQSPEARARVAEVNATFTDWRARCPACRQTRTGSIKQLRTQPCEHCGAQGALHGKAR